ncbi:hypothetical protein O983_21305 [Mycobacterium avium 09-5983]|nr:hypothetical protein O983_21305 [Mycobacterium avium 09-5983]
MPQPVPQGQQPGTVVSGSRCRRHHVGMLGPQPHHPAPHRLALSQRRRRDRGGIGAAGIEHGAGQLASLRPISVRAGQQVGHRGVRVRRRRQALPAVLHRQPVAAVRESVVQPGRSPQQVAVVPTSGVQGCGPRAAGEKLMSTVQRLEFAVAHDPSSSSPWLAPFRLADSTASVKARTRGRRSAR